MWEGFYEPSEEYSLISIEMQISTLHCPKIINILFLEDLILSHR